jgi:hypothetical protein
MPLIHGFDDQFFTAHEVLSKCRHDQQLMLPDVTYVHSANTVDFEGFDEMPDAIFLDGHMPGGWEKILDWIHEHLDLITKPLLIIPNSFDVKQQSNISGRVQFIASLGKPVTYDNFTYINLGGPQLFVEHISIYDYVYADSVLSRAAIAGNCGIDRKLPFPINEEEYDRIRAEMFSDSMRHPVSRQLSNFVATCEGTNFMITIKDQDRDIKLQFEKTGPRFNQRQYSKTKVPLDFIRKFVDAAIVYERMLLNERRAPFNSLSLMLSGRRSLIGISELAAYITPEHLLRAVNIGMLLFKSEDAQFVIDKDDNVTLEIATDESDAYDIEHFSICASLGLSIDIVKFDSVDRTKIDEALSGLLTPFNATLPFSIQLVSIDHFYRERSNPPVTIARVIKGAI